MTPIHLGMGDPEAHWGDIATVLGARVRRLREELDEARRSENFHRQDQRAIERAYTKHVGPLPDTCHHLGLVTRLDERLSQLTAELAETQEKLRTLIWLERTDEMLKRARMWEMLDTQDAPPETRELINRIKDELDREAMEAAKRSGPATSYGEFRKELGLE